MLFKAKKKARKPFGSADLVKKNADKMSKKLTAPEKQLKKILKELKVKFEPQKIIASKIYDFYVPQANLIIEVDGDYWHANPDIYSESDQNSIQKRNVKNDKFKETLALGRGYDIIRVWESELNNNYSAVKKKIKEKLGL